MKDNKKVTKFKLNDNGDIIGRELKNNSYFNSGEEIDRLEEYYDFGNESEDMIMDDAINNVFDIEQEETVESSKVKKQSKNKKSAVVKIVSIFGAVVILVNGIAAYIFRNNIKVASSNTSEIEDLIKYDSNGVIDEAKYFLVKVENCLEMVELSDKLYNKYKNNGSFTRDEVVYSEDGNVISFDENVYAELTNAYNVIKNEGSTRDEILKASVYLVRMGPTMEAWLENTSVLFSEYASKICVYKAVSSLGIDNSEQLCLRVNNNLLTFDRIDENGNINYSLPATGLAFNIMDEKLIEMINSYETGVDKKDIKEYARILRIIICSDDLKYVDNASIKIPAVIEGPEEVKTEVESENSSLSNVFVRKRV